MAYKKTVKNLAYLLLSFTLIMYLVFFGISPAFADQVQVNLTIPNTTPPPPPPPVDNPPTIGTVNVSVSTSTATITWTATDDKGVSSSNLVYGLTPSYGSVGVVTSSYSSVLNSLSQGTTYYYQILVTDTAGQTVNTTGSFITNSQDLTPPNLSGISIVPSVYSASVSWSTNENADAQVQYGLTSAYGLSVNNASFALSHNLSLPGLSATTTYHLKIIATDASGNATSTADLSFKTLPDSVPPSDVTALAIAASTTTLTLTWVNPVDTDFTVVKILRKIGSFPTSTTDGTEIYSGSGTKYADSAGLSHGVTYYYTVFSFDTSLNHSGGAVVSGQLQALPAVEICGNGVDDDGNGLTDCADPVCSALPICKIPTPEICNNGIDDDLNGKTDCADSACLLSPYCVAPSEICGNGIDDNGNGLIDCADSACSARPECRTPGGGGETKLTELCNNGIDDDGNGKIDCADPACIGYPSCVYVEPTSTKNTTTTVPIKPVSNVPEYAKIKSGDFSFFTANRQIQLYLQNNTITDLAGEGFSITVEKSKLASVPKSMSVTVDGQIHNFSYDESNQKFYSDFAFPQVGKHQAQISIDYGADQIDSAGIVLNSLPYALVNGEGKPLSGAEVALYSEKNQLFDTTKYGSRNPLQSSANGTYGWVVPNGRYYIIVNYDGYLTRKTPSFKVDNNVLNINVNLIPLPPQLSLNPGNITKIVQVTTELTLQKLSDTLENVQTLKENVQVQETASTVVAPAVVGVVAVSTISIVSWANMIAFLQLLFFEPLAFFGSRRKREGWGQVYNSLNKLPVDLATIRLISKENGRVIQSKVTDIHGRYAFVANPGEYYIEVHKNNFSFPSALLKESQNDGQKIDIYHGEVVTVSEKDAVITVNIPLDPVGIHKKPVRIFWQKMARKVQIVVSTTGLLVTIGALYISPRWYMWLLLFVHVVLFVVLRVLGTPPKIKSWGIVYDIETKRPVGRAIARLFNVQFNKLVASQITDNQGRYYFMAGDNEYYVTYEHPTYLLQRTNTIDLKGRDAETINVDIALQKQLPTQNPFKGSDSSASLETKPEEKNENALN